MVNEQKVRETVASGWTDQVPRMVKSAETGVSIESFPKFR